MRNDQSASEVKIKFKTREGFWHKIDEFPDESKNGRKRSKNPKPNPNHVGTFLKDLLRTVSRTWTVRKGDSMITAFHLRPAGADCNYC